MEGGGVPPGSASTTLERLSGSAADGGVWHSLGLTLDAGGQSGLEGNRWGSVGGWKSLDGPM